MLVFFTNLCLMEFQFRYLALFLLFSVIGSFGWFWMGSVHKNIQLMLEFLEAPLLVLHFSYYTLITFQMMLFVIMLSILRILLSAVSVIKHLICDNNYNWLLNLNGFIDWGRKWLVDFSAGKAQLIPFEWSDNMGTIDVKMVGSALVEKSFNKMQGLPFSSKLDWGSHIISMLKVLPRKLEP